ncbi:hypothetical protein LguiB_011733 [Lonicera macranthoides]
MKNQMKVKKWGTKPGSGSRPSGYDGTVWRRRSRYSDCRERQNESVCVRERERRGGERGRGRRRVGHHQLLIGLLEIMGL